MLTDGGDGGHDLAELELVEDGGLSGGVEPHHEDPHLLLGEQPAEQLCEREPHLFPLACSAELKNQNADQSLARPSRGLRPLDLRARHRDPPRDRATAEPSTAARKSNDPIRDPLGGSTDSQTRANARIEENIRLDLGR